MKPEELMVGDWVLWKNKPVQIAQISGIKYSFGHIDVVLAHCNDGNLLESHDIKSIEPISITPGILTKNWFHKEGSHYILYDNKEDNDFEPIGYEIRFYPKSNFCSIKNLETEADISFYCEYLHQLQQAMRLCGIDKEITLN